MIKKRVPEAKPPQKMQPLEQLPLFHHLSGQKIIVAGQTEGAIWKAELLAATGANVQLISPAPLNQIQEKIISEQGNIEFINRHWQKEDFFGAKLGICASIDDDDARAFVSAAKLNNIPVNIIDRPEFCDFQFGAIVNRSPLVIGIATNGASPAIGQKIRGLLEQMFPAQIANWVEKARQWRPKIKEKSLEFNQRRSFWHNFAGFALDNPSVSPETKSIEDFLETQSLATGKVFLVGAGPGDAELLTLKAIRALQMADVIMFDDLVEPNILDFARREAELIAVGKRRAGPSCSQSEICELLVKYAKDGKNIVRLKGGDALIFGRATEEIMACRNENIPLEIIPGISAAQGAAASLGISLTDRDHAQRVQFVTAAGKKSGKIPEVNFASLAQKDCTSFVYMARANIHEFVAELIKAGKDENTKAAIVINATRPNQEIIKSRLLDLPKIFENLETNGPELVVIGSILENAL